MAGERLRNSLKTQMLKMTVIPLCLMTVAIVTVSGSIVQKSINDQIHEELIYDAQLVSFAFDEFYAGDYRLEKDDAGEIQIYKGEQQLNSNEGLMHRLTDELNIDVSIFSEDVRILTTLKDANGNNAMGSKAAVVVKRDVLETGESAFYENVMVYDVKSFAYYQPIKDENGETIGMIEVCRSSGDVNKQAFQYVLPVIGICVFVAVFFGVIMVRYIRVLGDRISKMDRYMNRLASGEFDSEMPRELMADDDEIKSLATDGKKMARAIKMLVDFDALTELNNRRSADRRLEEIRIKMVEQGNKYCVCIADIDFFKKVNDTYGHDMGDVVLRMVASTLKQGMVGKGFVARWGGEEFLLIFDNRELDIAYRELNMIMDEIRTIIIPETDRQVTMSFGLTAMEPGETTDQTLSRADSNLYVAKENGRNQIVCK